VYLPALPAWTARRREIAARYRGGIRNERVECLPMLPRSESVDHLFPVLVPEGSKPEFLAYMRTRGILCGEHYPLAIPDQPAMGRAKCEIATPLEHARRIAEREVSLPIHPYLTDVEVECVIGACNEARFA
jgi:dTDP-3-amino-3,4,6-trideoxy-alpha-D-glucose transaminase